MRVGIVTVHDSSNLGSFLQAFGMQEMVRSQGDEPYIIESRSHFTTFCLYMGYNNAPSVRSARRFFVFLIKSAIHPRRTFNAYKKYLVYKKERKRFEKIIPFKKIRKIEMDCLLLGSDEIWNLNKPAFQNPYFYGENIKSKQKFAYAISCGDASSEKLMKFPKLLDDIKKLDCILVRDEHTKKTLADCGIDITDHICDPTLQIEIKKHMKAPSEVAVPKGPYIAVYTYSVNESYRNLIREFAKKNGLRTVAVSLPQIWCDEYCNCSALEFGAVLDGAEYVFTSTFHGTIFSALYHKKFISLAQSPKVIDILASLGLEECMISSSVSLEEFDGKIKQKHNFEDVDKKIFDLRKRSQTLYQKYIHRGNDNADL